MDINATLIGQMITFALFIWFTMKFVWPPLTRAMEERRKKIADGLAAAEQGQRELEQAKAAVHQQMSEAKGEASRIIDQANHRATNIVNEAKETARAEGERIKILAQSDIDQSYQHAKEQLMQQVGRIAVAASEKILKREVDKNTNDRLVEELINEI